MYLLVHVTWQQSAKYTASLTKVRFQCCVNPPGRRDHATYLAMNFCWTLSKLAIQNRHQLLYVANLRRATQSEISAGLVDVGQRGPLDAAGGDAECTVARCSRVVHFFRAWMYQDPCVHGRGLPLLVVPRVVEHPLEHLGHGGCRNLFHILCDIRRLLRLLSTKRRHVILLLRHTSWNGWSGEGDMRQAT